MAKGKILICESQDGRRAELVRVLAGLGAEIVKAPTMTRALRLLVEDGGFHLFIAGLDSLSGPPLPVLARFKKQANGLSVIALAAVRNTRAGLALLDKGIFDHLAAPDDLVGIYAAARNELERRALIAENALYARSVRKLKAEQLKNARKARQLEEIYDSTIENLMTALDIRDVETFGHSRTVAKYSQVLAKLLGIEASEALENIRLGALLHDIGKIAIPDAILHKPGALTPEEWRKIKLHPILGYGLIKEIKLVKEVGDIILRHHEHYDGSGYPDGLKNDDIPREARIFALADALDAITAHRPYRQVRDFPAARKEIVKNSGTQFDPAMVEAFCTLKPENWERIRIETTSFIPNVEDFSALLKNAKV
jgi:cyclic di-GMP phosphodiesterase